MFETNVKGMLARYYPGYKDVVDNEIIVIHQKATKSSALFYYITESKGGNGDEYEYIPNTFDVVKEKVGFTQESAPLHIHQEKTNMKMLFIGINGIEKARKTMIEYLHDCPHGNYPSPSEQQEQFDDARSPFSRFRRN